MSEDTKADGSVESTASNEASASKAISDLQELQVQLTESEKSKINDLTLQPIIFLLFWAFSFVTLFALTLIGTSGLKYSILWHPLTTSWFDIIPSTPTESFLKLNILPHPLNYFTVPIPLLTFVAGLFGFVAKGYKGLLVGMGLPIAALVLLFLVIGIVSIILRIPAFKLFRILEDRFSAWVDESNRKEALYWAQYDKQNKQYLSCSIDTRIRKIDDLPKPKRSIKLRFQGLKSQVCKPFSR